MKLEEKNLVSMTVFDRRMLAGTIATEYGNPTTAAKTLGITRQTLQCAIEGSRVHLNTAQWLARLLLKNTTDVSAEHVAEWKQIDNAARDRDTKKIAELDAIAKTVQSNVPGLQK